MRLDDQRLAGRQAPAHQPAVRRDKAGRRAELRRGDVVEAIGRNHRRSRQQRIFGQSAWIFSLSGPMDVTPTQFPAGVNAPSGACA
ncbi:hypothetical protein [Agrobacterium sp. LAD9]|uniref:hypothetical protein n=1 Tax=Agrobacterium sp. LAD9 TaxID=2055153 RepID=UPI000D1F99B5|nr:hypothetical protein [Agrobacterium sp. LAD9]